MAVATTWRPTKMLAGCGTWTLTGWPKKT